MNKRRQRRVINLVVSEAGTQAQHRVLSSWCFLVPVSSLSGVLSLLFQANQFTEFLLYAKLP